MPELPEVETVVRELAQKLKGKRILEVEVRMPKIVSVGPGVVSNRRTGSPHTALKFKKLLTGQSVLSVRRRGKMLIFGLTGSLSLLVHLKMTGQFIFEDKKLRGETGGAYKLLNKKTAPKVRLPGSHTHVVFKFRGATLYYNDIRQFGYLKVVEDKDLSEVREFAQYGPEPLEKSFTFEVFGKSLLRKSRSSIKLALMDPSIVVGIGNIYSDEILFLAKVRPERQVGSLEESEIRKVYKYMPVVLKKGIQTKGSSVGDFVRTDGRWGNMGKYHWVYGKSGKTCLICGAVLKSVKLGGRTATFCPGCQE